MDILWMDEKEREALADRVFGGNSYRSACDLALWKAVTVNERFRYLRRVDIQYRGLKLQRRVWLVEVGISARHRYADVMHGVMHT